MKSLLLGAFVVVVANGVHWSKEFNNDDLALIDDLKPLWEDWKVAFNREYSGVEEEAKRYEIWSSNLQRIADSNSKDYPYKLGLNQFSDKSDEEFRADYECMGKMNVNREPIRLITDKERKRLNLPASVDWQEKGKVTPVKNQGDCCSCWAFAATGAMECQYAIATGYLYSLSEQQLVDCSSDYGTNGCGHGWYYDAWNYSESAGGLCLESAYPYKDAAGDCQASTCGKKYSKPSNYSRVTPNSDISLEEAVAAGCVSVALDAHGFAFQTYKSGVLGPDEVCRANCNHAAVVVGYGYDPISGLDYWKVKNSWGTKWGEDGYINICRNCNSTNGDQGACGINMYPYTVQEGY